MIHAVRRCAHRTLRGSLHPTRLQGYPQHPLAGEIADHAKTDEALAAKPGPRRDGRTTRS